MVEQGILAEEEPIELLYGDLYAMSPRGPRHAWITSWFADRLRDALPGYVIREEKPLIVDEVNLPEPDIVAVRLSAEVLRTRHPKASEALLIVEVAATSQPRDRAKAALYAAAGVPRCWLVDLAANRVEVFTEPLAEGRYASVRVLGADATLDLPDDRGALPIAELMR